MKRINHTSLEMKNYSEFDEFSILSEAFSTDESLNLEFMSYRFSQVLYALKNVSSMVLFMESDGEIRWQNSAVNSVLNVIPYIQTFKNIKDLVVEFRDEKRLALIIDKVIQEGLWQGIVTCGDGKEYSSKHWLKLLITKSEQFGNQIVGVFTEINDDLPSLRPNFEAIDFFTGLYTLEQLKYDIRRFENNYQEDMQLYLYVVGVRNIADILLIRGQAHVDQIIRKYVQIIRPKLSTKFDIYKLSNNQIGLMVSTNLSAMEMSHRVRNFLEFAEYKVTVEGYEYHLKVHAGMSQFKPDEFAAENLIAQASLAQEIAANENRILAMHTDVQAQDYVTDLTMADRFYSALNNNELYMNYQPIMDNQGDIWGYEALVRWIDGIYGNVAADKIISYAEKNGTMIQLGYWIIKRVFSDITQLQSTFSNTNFVVSINLSIEQFKDITFAQTIYDISQFYDINPSRVMFEITETNAFDHMNMIIVGLRQLREFGFIIALDDFGVGYSTMTNLVDLPIDVVKIDKSLISSVYDNPDRVTICEMIVSLAKKLGLNIVAEGIENSKDESLIRELSIDLVQGYRYNRPMSIDKLHEILKTK